ncbi:uncharacterized protein LOC122392739 isoform X1 [Amphibalanus amphitrite]|uniref:uncharacterized protein LOC122392739 isoform X1 n=1 Tax=Amphibalanus amphitrite TaxID=1232801 RepID=UPI001C91F4AE|nr:uncharacterized protein LOC122392739 isoform X1 [Amphibalanus amphitrite]XP_043243916.1 uncharacterized protein LOC122392739 isoform X1 [Amphibalanus amphitrite]
MSFHRSEHLVTAFLCISGAAESCVLPFLCLHLSQLGVPPLQTGLAVAALLLLRGLGGALWWRSLRGGRRTGRRRLAAAVGALCSAAVLCALAALPPSVGCGDDGGVVVEHASSLPGLRPPADIVPAAGLGQGTDEATGSGGSSWSGLPSSPDDSRPTSDGGDGGAFHPPPVGQGSDSPWSESSGMPQHQSVGSQSSGHQRPETSETSGYQRPETSETSDHHWLETSESSEHLRPETSETSGHYQPEISETSGHYQPETSETSEHHRLETSHTNWDHEPETIETSSVNRPTNSGVTGENRPTDFGTSVDKRPSLSETNVHNRPEQSETNEQSDSSTLVQTTEASQATDSHKPHRTTSEISDQLSPSPSTAVEGPPLPSAQSGVSSSSVEGETDGSPRPERVEGSQKGTGDRKTGKEGVDEWSEGSQAHSPTVVNVPKLKPQRHHPKHDNTQKRPGGSQTVSIHAHGADGSQGKEISGPQTEDDSGIHMIPGTDHHTSNVPPAVTPSAQKPPPSGSQTPGESRPPVHLSGHQTSSVVDALSLEEDETEVRRTTRSPPPLESDENGSREDSESGQGESESDVFGEETEPVSSGDNKYHKSDEFHQSDNHLPPSPGSGRDSSELNTVTSNLSKKQGRPDKPDQLLPVAPPHSYSGDERDDHHIERQHPNQHHRHLVTDDEANNKSKDTGRQPSIDGMKSPTVGMNFPHRDDNEHHRTASQQRPTSDSSPSRDSGSSDVLKPHPSVQRPPVPPLSEESDNEAQPCVELSQIEIPWDPRKHPGGLTICDPSKPETGQRRGEGSGQPPGVDRGMLPGVETRQQTDRRQEHGSDHQRTHSVQRHRAPPAPPPPPSGNRDLSDLSPTNRDLSDLTPTNRDLSKPVPTIHNLPDLYEVNHNLPEPAPTRGQPGPPSGHDPGRSRHRAAGWRRVPMWSGDDQTPDHPHSVVSGPEPPTQPPPIVLVLRGTDSDSSGERKNYNTLDLTKDAVDLSSVILRPQDTLPLLNTAEKVQQNHNRAKTRVASESRREFEDRDGSESGLGTEDRDRGSDMARRPVLATRPHRLEKQHYESRDPNGEISSPVNPSVSGPLAVIGEKLVTADESLNSGGGYEPQSASKTESREAVLPTEADEVDRSRGQSSDVRPPVDAGSRDQTFDVRPSAKLGSRDFPRTVDPSGWSRRQLPGRMEDSSEQGSEMHTTHHETEDRGYPDSQKRVKSDIQDGDIPLTGVKDLPDSDADSRISPGGAFHYYQRRPIDRKTQHHDGRLPSRRHPNGDPRHYELQPRPADDSPTIEPTTGWSLTSALHRLEDLSPTLNRLLSGGKRRRETRQRRRETSRGRWREGDRRRRRRRYKRSLLSGLTSWKDLREDDTEKDTRQEELNNRWEVVRRVPEQMRLERNADNREEAGVPARSQFQLRARPASRYLRAESGEAKGWNYNFSKSLERQPQLPQIRSGRDLRSVPSAPTSPHPSPLDPYLLFLITLALLSLWGTAGAPHRRLVLHCWRHALDEAEHLERVERPRPAAEAAAAALLATAAGLWPLLPSCLPAGRQPLAALMALGAALTLLGGLMVPWLPMVAGKEPPPRTAAVLRTLVSSRSSLLFTIAVFVTGLLTSAEFHFLFPLTATWRPAPRALLLLAAAAALASRLPVRALYRPLMVRCGFVGSVVLSFTALSTRCLCYVCIPTGWALVAAQLLSGLTETLFWRAAHVFVDKTTHDDYHQSTLAVLEALYAVGRCCGVLLAGAAFSTVGGTATFAALATVASAAALGYYVAARFSGDAPDLTYSKLPCEDGAETTALTGVWSRDTDDLDEVTDPPPAPGADQDWLERAMRQEGLL